MLGGNGSDNALGGSGNDFVYGHTGSDRLVGEEGRDQVDGGPGSDRVVGGEGGDALIEGPLGDDSKDFLSGGAGDDNFFVKNRPASRDIVSCGRGFDRVAADRKDVVSDDCERVFASFQAIDESIPPAGEEFFNTFFDQLAPYPE